MSTQDSRPDSELSITDFASEDVEERASVDWSALTPAIQPLADSNTDYDRDATAREQSRMAAHTDTQQSTRPRCRNCGSSVSQDYARVLGDQHGEVHECLNCEGSSQGRRKDGATAGLEVRERGLGGVVQ